MKPALGYKSLIQLQDWSLIPKGQMLRCSEQEIIEERLKYCFGQYLLKIGALSSEIKTDSCAINTQVNLTSEQTKKANTVVVGELEELPFLESSIDAVVMNHVLEYGSDPHQLLREVHRVLLPNGNLIISVFNPISLLAAFKFIPNQNCTEFKSGRFFTISRIKDWLQLLGFEITYERNTYFPFDFSDAEQQRPYLTDLVKRLFPWSGGVCVLVAKKREWPLTPIRPRVRYKTVFNPAVRTGSFNNRNS
ncbi:class I SAM-dependent methyltransferase [Psychrosphaera sp.]|nr:class I SAM-dependent methyltransferase [Psychrosphaera sp.]